MRKIALSRNNWSFCQLVLAAHIVKCGIVGSNKTTVCCPYLCMSKVFFNCVIGGLDPFFFNMVPYCNYYEKMLCYIYGVLFVPFFNVLTVIVLYSKMFLCIENVNSLKIKLIQIESH